MSRTGRRISWVVFGILCGSLVVAFGTAPSISEDALPETGLELDSHAPDFSLTTPSGETVVLSAFRGQVVILYFWATWCEPCEGVADALAALKEEANGYDLVVIAIAYRTSSTSLNMYVQSTTTDDEILFVRDIAVPSGDDFKYVITDAFRIHCFPMVVVLDKQGVVRVVKNPHLLTLEDLKPFL